jgi:glycosyltransferase involved in cell wall biosynthesis
MHILYVHQNFPAQFGHIAAHLIKTRGWKCSFVSETPAGVVDGIEKVQYKLLGGATKQNHFCTRTFENTVWHCDGVYRALRARPDLKPDLIVGHSGFGSTLFLRELYPDVPVINFFEYYYRPHDADSDMEFRRDLNWPVPEIKFLRSRCRNAMILLDLQNCQVGYTPTNFQLSRFPGEYHDKIRTIFDGVDRSVYHGYDGTLRPPVGQRGERTIAGVKVGPNTRVVTYVSRGFESMRGFDVFMKAARIIAKEYDDVVFIVIGTDRVAYGGDETYTGGKSFKDWVLSQEPYDLSKFRFVGRVPPEELGRALAATDLHIYLTVPFVLSWSMMDAMSCGAVVLGSDTAPVREMITDGQNGLLADFFSPQAFAEKALAVLRDPDAFRPLGQAAEQMIVGTYCLDAVLPQMLALYDEALSTKAGLEPARARPEGEFRMDGVAQPVPGDVRKAAAGAGNPNAPGQYRGTPSPAPAPRPDAVTGVVKTNKPLPFSR